ncbi:hypothetical protein BJX68DRAFT_262278 [Aspergillus pseudodeflectus]|uniref:SWIM-type domain-containing protein n=1 Tax=Aspergillus pseudodeflectus TaxID=176178 RepID=A0ABR4L2I5_9EURO
MSTPTRQLRGLSIRGDSRQTAAIETETETDREGFPATTRKRFKDTTMGATDPLFDLSAVRSSAGLLYDLTQSALDDETKARAILGLTTGFDVRWCSSSLTGWEFVIGKQVRVRIGSDSSRRKDARGGQYTCTCAVFRTKPDVACQHIFWLLDQLRGYFASTQTPSPPQSTSYLPSRDGHAQKLSQTEPRIEHLIDLDDNGPDTIEAIADRLKWPYMHSDNEGHMTRVQRVRDILSAFSTDVLPEEFRVDLVEVDEDKDGDEDQVLTRTRRTPEQCVVQGDFEATLLRLAVHDDEVFASLRKAMPPGACAAIYFDKVLDRSRKLLADFDRFCRDYGRPGEDKARNHVSIYAVVETLRRSVDSVHDNILSRDPHGRLGAVKTLVTLLGDISNRNKDALDNNKYGQKSFANEDEDTRNIYHQLIGTTDETESYFILDALECLPGADLHQFKSQLRAILNRNEVNRAPRAYILKLDALVRAAEAGEIGTATGVIGVGLARKRSAGGREGAQGEGSGKRLR